MRYFVTGAAGLVGRYTSQSLTDLGEEVIGYDLISQIKGHVVKGEFIQGDIRDRDAVSRAIRDTRPDVIIHVAAILAHESIANPALAIDVNCTGTLNVLEAASLAQVRRVICAGTTGVFANRDIAAGPIADDEAYSPKNVYGASKIFAEQLGKHYSQNRNLETSTLRFPVMIGLNKGQSLSARFAAELIEKPVKGIPASVPFGDDRPSWLWAGDAARALVLAAKSSRQLQHAYNVGGDNRSLREAANIVSKLLPNTEIKVESGRFGLEYTLDSSGAERDFGFHWEWSLEAQLDELIRQAKVLFEMA